MKGFDFNVIKGRWQGYGEVTPEQKRIVEEIANGLFDGVLKPSAPKMWGSQHHTTAQNGNKDVDFISVDGPGYNPDIARAFFWAVNHWPGGAGIGILQADPHLHLDLRGKRSWIEIDKTVGNEIVKDDPRWRSYKSLVKRYYKFFDENPTVITPEKEKGLLDNLKDILSSIEGIAKASLAGYVGYHIFKFYSQYKESQALDSRQTKPRHA